MLLSLEFLILHIKPIIKVPFIFQLFSRLYHWIDLLFMLHKILPFQRIKEVVLAEVNRSATGVPVLECLFRLEPSLILFLIFVLLLEKCLVLFDESLLIRFVQPFLVRFLALASSCCSICLQYLPPDLKLLFVEHYWFWVSNWIIIKCIYN